MCNKTLIRSLPALRISTQPEVGPISSYYLELISSLLKSFDYYRNPAMKYSMPYKILNLVIAKKPALNIQYLNSISKNGIFLIKPLSFIESLIHIRRKPVIMVKR